MVKNMPEKEKPIDDELAATYKVIYKDFIGFSTEELAKKLVELDQSRKKIRHRHFKSLKKISLRDNKIKELNENILMLARRHSKNEVDDHKNKTALLLLKGSLQQARYSLEKEKEIVTSLEKDLWMLDRECARCSEMLAIKKHRDNPHEKHVEEDAFSLKRKFKRTYYKRDHDCVIC